MSPVDWAKRPLQKYADFSGRASRAEYWWFVLALIVCYVIVNIVESLLGTNRMIMGVYGPLLLLLWLGTLVPQIAVSVRRLHDTNRSGWWMLLLAPYVVGLAMAGPALMSGSMTGLGMVGLVMMIGMVCAIVLLVFMVLAGTPADNRYGPDPYAGGGSAAIA
jgi:uncharacterized membrane protein YhaH (DUF805 family)